MRLFILLLFSINLGLGQNQYPSQSTGSNFQHRPGTPLVDSKKSLIATIHGSGNVEVILLTSHGHGEYFYDSLIKRNIKGVKFHIITPPGMGNTAAYPWPDKADEFETRDWSTRLEREIREYINANCVTKPFFLSVWYSGVSTAFHLASEFPELLRGIIIVGKIPYYPLTGDPNSFNLDLHRSELAKLIPYWKSVDEYTWHKNTFRGAFYSQQFPLSLEIKYREAIVPMVIPLRYFIEYLSDDIPSIIAKCKIPVLVMSPVFSKKKYEQLMPDAAPDYKNYLQKINEAWSGANKTIAFIEDSGLMVWVDQPSKFDQLLLDFITIH